MSEAGRRSIRSYVLRQGRVTAAQASAVERLMPVYGIAYSPAPLDLEQAFGRRAPKILEVGFGMGETTAAIAQAHPESDYLGIEVHSPGVGALLRRIEALGLSNVRVVQHDAIDVVEQMIAPGTLDGVHVFFPDPWPKKRHHKRRFFRPSNVARLAEVLAPGGLLRIKTDHGGYAAVIGEVLAGELRLAPVPAEDTFEGVPPSNFEVKYAREARPVHRLAYRRV